MKCSCPWKKVSFFIQFSLSLKTKTDWEQYTIKIASIKQKILNLKVYFFNVGFIHIHFIFNQNPFDEYRFQCLNSKFIFCFIFSHILRNTYLAIHSYFCKFSEYYYFHFQFLLSFNQSKVSIGKEMHDESLNYENAEHDLIFHGRNSAKPNHVTFA